MSDAPPPEPFLRGQPLSVLSATDPDLIRALVCHTEVLRAADGKEFDPSKYWAGVGRAEVVEAARTAEPGRRVALVCEAGLGKTTNTLWLLHELCEEHQSRQLPFLLRLDGAKGHAHDLDWLVAAERDPDSLLERLAEAVVRDTAGAEFGRVRESLIRKRRDGQITLLIDGLDHALSRPGFPTTLANVLKRGRWEGCPVILAGRPYAFQACWADLFDRRTDDWQFLQVERFGEAEIRRYLELRTGHDWYSDLPAGCRPLLGVPRLLKLIAGVIRSALKRSPGRPPAGVVRELKLDTPAAVYHRAFFEPGRYEDQDTQGLIAQGIKDLSRDIGLIPDQPARQGNFVQRIKRVGVLLGAVAFHLFDHNPEADPPEPNTGGACLEAIKEKLIGRLEAAGQGGLADFDRDFDYLRTMNAHHLQFLLLESASEEWVRFQDRTVQAFFAASWAMRFGTETDREHLSRWITGSQDLRLEAFDEFWRFAAEMPDPLVDADKSREANRWHLTFAPCYAPPQALTGTQEWVQWHRRMLYHTFPTMEERFPQTAADWRQSFRDLASPGHPGHAVWAEFFGSPGSAAWDENFRAIPAGPCFFGADPLASPPNPGERIEEVPGFRLHRYPVTNLMYELFDPAHREWRWGKWEDDMWKPARHPLGMSIPGGDDRCPVVNVTWYDGWCYAAWCGAALPTEREWEHAVRAGTALRYSYGDDESAFADHAWFAGNSGGMTHPVGERPVGAKRHRHGLFDLHGNVWEWVYSWRDSGQMLRVVRGGSCIYDAWFCRAAHRYWGVPGSRGHFDGFRLLLPGSG